MAQIRYKKYRIYAVLVFAILLYFILRTRKNNFRLEFDVAQTNPAMVWEYVADFSNMKNLNPTILDFTIESENGNYDHWEYTAVYTEFLSHLPFIRHKTHGDFEVRPDGDDFVIKSHHRTCFLPASFGCVNTDSEFRFRASAGPSTRCSETVVYECPTILSALCAREVAYQRYAIRDNLRKHFANKKFVANS